MEIFIRDYVINLLQINKEISENTGKFRKWQIKSENKYIIGSSHGQNIYTKNIYKIRN